MEAPHIIWVCSALVGRSEILLFDPCCPHQSWILMATLVSPGFTASIVKEPTCWSGRVPLVPIYQGFTGVGPEPPRRLPHMVLCSPSGSHAGNQSWGTTLSSLGWVSVYYGILGGPQDVKEEQKQRRWWVSYQKEIFTGFPVIEQKLLYRKSKRPTPTIKHELK